MKTILVADDDKLNLNNAMKILTPVYKVIPVPSGKMALNYLSKNIPDLILLDVLMPEMDGFEVMRQIRANREWADSIRTIKDMDRRGFDRSCYYADLQAHTCLLDGFVNQVRKFEKAKAQPAQDTPER